IICIDDASTQPAAERLAQLLRSCARLRVLRFDQPRGTSAMLTAGLAAARGKVILAMDARDAHASSEFPQLISRLSRCDAAVARRQRPLLRGLRLAGLRMLRVLTRSGRLHADEDLLWASRRSALDGLTLPRGAFRFIEG